MADLSITAANVVAQSGASTASGTAGDTITAGMSLYSDSSDSNKLKKADADVATTAACVGIALHGASSGQPLKYQTGGNLTAGATLTVGETYVVSTTAGGIAPISDLASGDYVSILGVASSASTLAMTMVISGTAKA